MATMRCYNCGAEFEGRFCPYCGCPAPATPPQPPVQQKKKKTWLLVVLIALAVAIVVSCAAVVVTVLDDRSNTSLRDRDRDRDDEDEDDDDDYVVDAPAIEAPVAEAPATEAPAEAPAAAPSTPFTVSEQQIYSEGGITVTVKKVTESYGSYELHFELVNDTNQKVTVSSQETSINGCMVDSILYGELAPGKKANETMYIFSDDLEEYGITTIGEIVFYLRVYNSETYATIDESDLIYIRTPAYGTFQQTHDDSGEVLYDKGGIRIIKKSLEDDSYMGPTMILYIENNSDNNIIIMSEEASMNGYMANETFYSSLRPGTVDMATMWFLDAEEIGVTTWADVEDLEIRLEILNADTYYELGNTGLITFNFN